ncbi:MAG: hypothetical protein AB1609_21965 [Bacillota bacterium]
MLGLRPRCAGVHGIGSTPGLPGNTADPKTVGDPVRKLRERFGLRYVVLVGDRGMLTQARIEALKGIEGMAWISALRAPALRQLMDQGLIQPSLFDQQDLAEITSPDYPGERLVVCRNPICLRSGVASGRSCFRPWRRISPGWPGGWPPAG